MFFANIRRGFAAPVVSAVVSRFLLKGVGHWANLSAVCAETMRFARPAVDAIKSVEIRLVSCALEVRSRSRQEALPSSFRTPRRPQLLREPRGHQWLDAG
jgi:hypothetical protein